ncbi:MAG: hypothetical protein GQ527_11285 [Bacteroidales bacterium]|nr:hypothetical protein [Bacteroidales bacterium]
MKQLFIYLNLVLFMALVSCQSDVEINLSDDGLHDLVFDSTLATEYGADAYGMKKYVIAFLKRGNNTDIDADSSRALQMAHLENIERMAKDGKLVLAGPFLDSDDLRGIYIFNVQSIDEARDLTNSDPAIKAGILQMELKEWYGSAALMAINDLHHRLSQKKVY